MKNWKKAITFSYDDGVTQDKRLIALFNRYGIRGTFNLNSELLGKENHLIREGVRVDHTKIQAADVRGIYAGHEIAVHTLTHPNLENLTDDEEIARQVEVDRINLSELAGYEVTGMAYPGGGLNYSDKVVKVLKTRTGVQYARTTVSNYGFDTQQDLYRFKPSVYHVMEMEKMFELGRLFLDGNAEEKQIFYIWGHSYEFDIYDTWDRFEEFLKMISGRNDIFYGTNREVLLGD